MTHLVTGQNTTISNISAYRLQLTIDNWNWGVLIFKSNQSPYHLQDEPGIAQQQNNLLIHGADIDADFNKLIVYISKDGSGSNNSNSNNNSNNNSAKLSASLIELLSKKECASIAFTEQEHKETALVLLEVYKHKDSLKIKCVRQGFEQGLNKLFDAYGAAQKKSNESIVKCAGEEGKALVTMVWENKKSSEHNQGNIFIGQHFNPITDLRLGCMYQLKNGQIGITQTIGDELLGSFYGVPYIEALHSNDTLCEKLQINLQYKHKLHRYLIYALMVEGQSNWSDLNIKLNFDFSALQDENYTPDSLMVKPIYAVAMLHFEQDTIKITSLNEYFNNLPELDHAYGWGLPWRHQNESQNEE